METLEENVRDGVPRNKDIPPFFEGLGVFYEGLRLVEDRAYTGYTSIKYWM